MSPTEPVERPLGHWTDQDGTVHPGQDAHSGTAEDDEATRLSHAKLGRAQAEEELREAWERALGLIQ